MTPKTKLKEPRQVSSGVKRRKLVDHIATFIVTTGGIAIIISIIAILVFIGIETIPLWKGVESELTSSFFLKESPELASYSLDSPEGKEFPFLATGTEEYKEIGFVVTDDGYVYFLSLKDGSVIKKVQLAGLEGNKITSSFVAVNNELYGFGTENGVVLPVETNYKINFEGDHRVITPEVAQDEQIKVSDASIVQLAFEKHLEEDSYAGAIYTSSGELLFLASKEKSGSLLGGFGGTESNEDDSNATEIVNLTEALGGTKATAMELDYYLSNLFVGTNDGKIYHWDINDKESPELLNILDAENNSRSPVTALAFLLGDRSLVVGNESGDVSVWFEVSDPDSPRGKIYKKVHELPPMELPVANISTSSRDRGFLVSDKGGNINLYYATTGEKMTEYKTDGATVKNLAFTPKANGESLSIIKANSITGM